MTEVAVSEVRARLIALIDRSSRTSEPMFITQCGRRVAVLLDYDTHEWLCEQAEDAIDRVELLAAREVDAFVPWDEAKADLDKT